jgi:hypothetical protein
MAEMGGTCNINWEIRMWYKIFARKPEDKRSLGRPRHKWEDNIKMDLKYCAGVKTEFKWLRRCSSGWIF